MFGKVKNWLGIEGVKLELDLPEEVSAKTGVVKGKIRLYSMNNQTVTAMRVTMIERYSRGRKADKLTDEYELGEIYLDNTIKVKAEQPVEVEFELPFELLKSEMDEIADKNPIAGGIVDLAKWFQGASSDYKILAEAKVKGVALDPFDKQSILIKM